MGHHHSIPSAPKFKDNANQTQNIPKAPPLRHKLAWRVETVYQAKLLLQNGSIANIHTDPMELLVDIDGVSKSTAGSGGVVFVKTSKLGVLVIKGGSTIAQEMFGVLVGQKCGARVADMSICSMLDNTDVYETLRNRLGVYSEAHTIRLLASFILGLMEFVPGSMPYDLHGKKARRYYTKSRLQSLGNLVVLDVIVNNPDRFPMAMWQNDGNPGNVMLAEEGFVGIDNRAATIDMKFPRAQKYEKKITALVNDVKTKQHEASCFMDITSFLEMFSMIKFTEMDRRAIYQGFINGVRHMATSFKTYTDLQRLKSEILEPMVKVDMNNIWADAMKSIHVEFVWHNIEILRELCHVNTLNLPGSITKTDQEHHYVVNVAVIQQDFRKDFRELENLLKQSHHNQIIVLTVTQEKKGKDCTNILAKLAKKHEICIIVTINFQEGKNKQQVDCKFFDDKGKLNMGKSVPDAQIFGTKFGPIGVLLGQSARHSVIKICDDHNVFLLINATCVSSEDYRNQPEEFLLSTFKTSMATTNHEFQIIASENEITYVRLEQPFPSGVGSTTIVQPSGTIFSPHMHSHVMQFQCSPIARANSFYDAMKPPDNVRTRALDNTGSTYHSILRKAFQQHQGHSRKVVCIDTVKDYVAAGVEGGDVEIWHVRKGHDLAFLVPMDNKEVIYVKWGCMEEHVSRRYLYIATEKNVYKVAIPVTRQANKSPTLRAVNSARISATLIQEMKTPLLSMHCFLNRDVLVCAFVNEISLFGGNFLHHIKPNDVSKEAHRFTSLLNVTDCNAEQQSEIQFLLSCEAKGENKMEYNWYFGTLNADNKNISFVCVDFDTSHLSEVAKDAESENVSIKSAAVSLVPLHSHPFLIIGLDNGMILAGYMEKNEDDILFIPRITIDAYYTQVVQVLGVGEVLSYFPCVQDAYEGDHGPKAWFLYLIISSEKEGAKLWRLDFFRSYKKHATIHEHKEGFDVIQRSLVHTFRVNMSMTEDIIQGMYMDEQRYQLWLLHGSGCMNQIKFNYNYSFVSLSSLCYKPTYG